MNKVVRKFNPFSWFFRHWRKIGLVILVGLAAYMIYLDAVIQDHFSGNKWQVPAQIYARPLTLEIDQEITPDEIIEELTLLGYRRGSRADQTGEYQQSGNQFTIMRRGFHFPDGYEGAYKAQLTIRDGRLKSIVNLSRNKKLKRFRLEPWLVTRLVNAGREDRMLVTMDEVPSTLVDALLLVEDQHFYEHHGVAPLAIARALVANITAGRAVQGGSTLTQQLVKNLYLSSEKSLVRKVKEALMALLIDARYSKDEILEAYLNEVFLGQNGAMAVHGFGLASYFYFDRPLSELDIVEVATLVSMIKGPSYYNPRRYPERVEERRNLVIRMLFDANHINRQEYIELIARPLDIASGASLAKGKHPAFMQQVNRELRQILADPEMRQSGVKVFTSMDPNAQRKAEAAMQASLGKLEKQRKLSDLQGAMVVTEADKGEVRALVGDREVTFKGFNRALDAQRSIGSLVKPAIYLSALEQASEYNLATPLEDKPIKLQSSQGKMWEPQNADKKFRGSVPLVTALSGSLNVPTVSLGMQLGIPNVVEALHRLGIEGEIPQYPALTLGAVDLSPWQVNQMYQTIANNGSFISLHTVTAIQAPDNELLWQFRGPEQQRFDERAVYLLNFALHKVTLEGTARAVRQQFPQINMAGKTGTTDDYRDSWFAGFDKDILVTSWVGRDDNQPTGLTGASGALTLFTDFQARREPKSLVRRFPDGLGIAHFNQTDGRMTEAGCKEAMSVPAILDALPQIGDPCPSGPIAKPKRKKTWWEKIFGD